MKCREFVEFVMEYLDGTLGESERRVFEDHVGLCPPCVNYLNSYKATIAASKSLCDDPKEPAEVSVPEDLINAILAARAKS